MIAGYIIIVVVAYLLIAVSKEHFHSLLFLILYSVLLLQIVEYVLKPFAEIILENFSFVPYSQLLLICALLIFLSATIKSVLEQIGLESIAPLTDISIRFLVFLYCLKELKPAIESMQLIVREWT